MSRMGEYAAEHSRIEEPGQGDEYPRKVRMVFYMTSGDPIQSSEIILKNEKENQQWGAVLRDQKNAGHYAVPVMNAFGEEDSIFINPTYVMAVRVIDIKDF